MKSDAPRRSPSRPKVPPPAAAPATTRPVQPRRALVTAAVLFVAALPAFCEAGDIPWRRSYSAAYYEAGREGKPMLIHVSASWCAPCHRMLEETYSDPYLNWALGGPFVPLMLDADDDAAWLERLGVESVPTVLVVNAERRVIHRLSGFQSAGELTAALASAAPPTNTSSPTRHASTETQTVGISMMQSARSAP